MALPAPIVGDPAAQLNFEWISDHLIVGRGSPAGKVKAKPGVLYLNESGGAATTLYVKETGTDATGWVAK